MLQGILDACWAILSLARDNVSIQSLKNLPTLFTSSYYIGLVRFTPLMSFQGFSKTGLSEIHLFNKIKGLFSQGYAWLMVKSYRSNSQPVYRTAPMYVEFLCRLLRKKPCGII